MRPADQRSLGLYADAAGHPGDALAARFQNYIVGRARAAAGPAAFTGLGFLLGPAAEEAGDAIQQISSDRIVRPIVQEIHDAIDDVQDTLGIQREQTEEERRGNPRRVESWGPFQAQTRYRKRHSFAVTTGYTFMDQTVQLNFGLFQAIQPVRLTGWRWMIQAAPTFQDAPISGMPCVLFWNINMCQEGITPPNIETDTMTWPAGGPLQAPNVPATTYISQPAVFGDGVIITGMLTTYPMTDYYEFDDGKGAKDKGSSRVSRNLKNGDTIYFSLSSLGPNIVNSQFRVNLTALIEFWAYYE